MPLVRLELDMVQQGPNYDYDAKVLVLKLEGYKQCVVYQPRNEHQAHVKWLDFSSSIVRRKRTGFIEPCTKVSFLGEQLARRGGLMGTLF